MIVKILSPVKGFPGVKYNTDKIDRNLGELMQAANFGPIQYLSHLRPQDYVNYLQMVSRLNKRTTKPQFHAVISAKGNTYSKVELNRIAVSWMQEMGYGAQPYLVIFHRDTLNNHVHLVSTRIDRDGRKISSAYEKIRAQKQMNNVLGYEAALQYRFSTKAQFYSILESLGYPGRDHDTRKLEEHINAKPVNRHRIEELKVLFKEGLRANNLKSYFGNNGIELLFHQADGKLPYGYTILDHTTKQAFKGSEVMPLKALLNVADESKIWTSHEPMSETPFVPVYIPPIWIADDVDDQQVLGMKRKRQRKARTNTR